MDDLCIDMKVVDQLKEIQKNGSRPWKNIEKVGESLKELTKQLNIATNAKKRKKISELMSKYVLQNVSSLLQPC